MGICIESVRVFNIVGSVYSARNPMNSWGKSDSNWETDTLGVNDLELAKKLAKAGSDHAKYLRTILVTVDVTAPLYWWKQFDQYKVGVTTNSCSTMHKIHAKEFTPDDFSHEQLSAEWLEGLNLTVALLNRARTKYLETKDKRYWWQMIQLLPSSYNQKRTVQLNYQVLKSLYPVRSCHKLDEWQEFCKWAETLPYFKEICIDC